MLKITTKVNMLKDAQECIDKVVVSVLKHRLLRVKDGAVIYERIFGEKALLPKESGLRLRMSWLLSLGKRVEKEIGQKREKRPLKASII